VAAVAYWWGVSRHIVTKLSWALGVGTEGTLKLWAAAWQKSLKRATARANGPEVLEERAAARRGRPLSAELRRKISDSQRLRHARRRGAKG
jgi:hypothetical protein